MNQYKTEEEILAKVQCILERMKHETDEQQGVSDTELDLLWIELQDLKNPEGISKGKWSKHPWN